MLQALGPLSRRGPAMIFATLPQRCNRILDPRPAAASLLPFRYADESTSRLFAPMQLLRHAGRSRPFHTTTSHGAPGRSGKNHYETLGVQSDAPLKDIKSRFYKLSKQYHPDVNKDSDEAHSKFIKINEAYTILSNPLSRREYDRTLRVSDRDGGVTASRSGFGGFRRPPARTAYYGSDHRGSATSWSRASASQQTGQHQHQHQHQRYQGMGGHAHGANTTGPSSSSRSFDFNEWEQKHYGAERAARAEKIRRQAERNRAADRQWSEGEAMARLLVSMTGSWILVLGVGASGLWLYWLFFM